MAHSVQVYPTGDFEKMAPCAVADPGFGQGGGQEFFSEILPK